MADYELYNSETAPEGAQQTLKGIEGKYGFVPNLFAGLAESPESLNALLGFYDNFGKTSLSPTESQVVTITASVLNGCEFCVAAHTTIAKGAGVSEEVLNAIRNGEAQQDAKLNALAEFTKLVVTNRGWVSDEDVQAFLNAGYTKAQALEVVAGVALKTFTNYANHIMHTPVNEEFKDNLWHAPEGSKAA